MKLAALALSLVVLMPACDAPVIEVRESRIQLRVDETAGTLEWVSIAQGVMVSDHKGFEHLQSVLAGARTYPIEGEDSFSINFDQVNADETSKPWMHEIAPDISVVGVGLAEDSDGSLTLWRHTRVTRAPRVLTVFQRENNETTELTLGEFPTFDATSLELQRTARGAGAVEWRIEGRALVFEVPSTLDNALRCQEVMVAQGTQRLSPFLPFEVSYFSYKDGRFAARYLPRDNGWILGCTTFDANTPTERFASVADFRTVGVPVETPAELSARFAHLGIVD
jgi:hypothetical protein